MNVKQLLKKVSREFNLKFDQKNKFKHLDLTKREIVIGTFISGCPDPRYIKHGNNKPKVHENIIKFLKSKEYKEDLKRPHGRVISQKELKNELKIIKKLTDPKLIKETNKIYTKIKKKIGSSKRLTLIWKPNKKEEKSNLRNEILLHEFIHELLEDNKIRPKSWKWNEGLVTYLTSFALNTHSQHEKPPKKMKGMVYSYYLYAHKWSKLLKELKDPKSRKEILKIK